MSTTVTSDVETDTGALPFAPGDLVGERYSIQRLVARGGMGVVYEARDVDTDERVALKCLRPERALSTIARARFDREAKLLERLTHENIVRMERYGVHDGRSPFFVMEYLDGLTLDHSLKLERRPPLATTVDIVTQICRAVACAHSLDITHRDLKPANIMLVQKGTRMTVKLLDFGIGARTSGAQTRLTASSADLGTACYMSPEQARGQHEAGKSSDVYAIGLIFYELLTGRRAYSGGSYNAVLFEILTQSLRTIHDVAPDCPLGLRQVVDRCLAVDLRKRYPDALALSRDLETTRSGFAAEPTVLPALRSPTRFTHVRSSLWALGAATVVLGVLSTRIYVASARHPATISVATELPEARAVDSPKVLLSTELPPTAVTDAMLARNPGPLEAIAAKRQPRARSTQHPIPPRQRALAASSAPPVTSTGEAVPIPTLTFQTRNPY